jgi:hypothetical protein
MEDAACFKEFQAMKLAQALFRGLPCSTVHPNRYFVFSGEDSHPFCVIRMVVRNDNPVERGGIKSDFGQPFLHLLARKPGIRKDSRIIALDEKGIPGTAAGKRGDFHPLLSCSLRSIRSRKISPQNRHVKN